MMRARGFIQVEDKRGWQPEGPISRRKSVHEETLLRRTMTHVADELPIDVVPKPEVVTPRLPGAVVLRPDADQLIDALLADLLIHSRNCVRAFGDFHLAISATEEAEPYLRRLMYDPNYRDFPWIRTRVWMVDEAPVDTDDPQSRYARLRDLVLEQSGIPKEQLHRIDAAAPGAVEAYEAELRQHLGWREKGHDRLDFVLLTLSESGGVAAFESDADAPAGLLVHAVPLNGPDAEGLRRASMSMEFINASRVVAVIAGGQERRPILTTLSTPKRAETRAAALRLRPLAGELRWYLDYAACQARGA
jgi:6-phosphogluconolactonase/glucosamine-6-phosphate isomerase/deaminase